jgi:fructose/tagatose bisphosphate aldolase
MGIPLVLHGGSGIPSSQLREAICLGICKANINTELSRAGVDAVREKLQSAKTPPRMDALAAFHMLGREGKGVYKNIQ